MRDCDPVDPIFPTCPLSLSNFKDYNDGRTSSLAKQDTRAKIPKTYVREGDGRIYKDRVY